MQDALWRSLAKKISLCACIMCAALGVFGVGHQNSFTHSQTDIQALRYVGQLARQGVSPYSREAVIEGAHHFPFVVDEFFYPPSAIPFVVALSFIEPTTVRLALVALQIVSAAMFIFLCVTPRQGGATFPGHRVAHVLLYFSPVLLLALYHMARTGQVSCFVVVASLLFWQRYRANPRIVTWREIALLSVATIKPSIAFTLVIFLVLERRFILLTSVALVHIVSALAASVVTGLSLLSLTSGWREALLRYRFLPQNAPTGSFVYGISSAVSRVWDSAPSLELLAFPITYLLWRQRKVFSDQQLIALLVLVAFILGTPHAYDFFMVVPALLYTLGYPSGLLVYSVVSVLIILPQRIVAQLGVSSFDSSCRVLAPLILFGYLWFLPGSRASRNKEALFGSPSQRELGV